MDTPTTLLTLIETGIVSMLLGASTVAVMSYALSLRHGYPKEGMGHHLIKSVYALIRLFHVFFVVLVVISFVLFGFLDGVPGAMIEYGVKATVLFIQALFAYGMAVSILPVKKTWPLVAAGWYFLATYHIITLHVSVTTILMPVLTYLLFIAIFQVVKIVLERFFIREVESREQQREV